MKEMAQTDWLKLSHVIRNINKFYLHRIPTGHCYRRGQNVFDQQ